MTPKKAPRSTKPAPVMAQGVLNGQLLVSVAVGLDGTPPALLTELWQGLVARYQFFELLLIGGAAQPAAVNEFVRAHANVRLVLLTQAPGYEEIFNVALEHSIGDVLVLGDPQHDDMRQIPTLVDACATQAAMVLAHDTTTPVRGLYARASRLYYRVLALLTGHEYLAHSVFMALGRPAITHLLRLPLRLRLVRFNNAQTGLPTLHLPLAARQRRQRPLRQGLRHIGQSLQLALLQSERLSWALTLGCLLITLLCGVAMMYALLMWLLKPGVATGWTSEVLLLAGLFGMLFLIIGIVVQYLLVLLREVRQAPLYTVAGELTNTDLFRHAPTTNVTREI